MSRLVIVEMGDESRTASGARGDAGETFALAGRLGHSCAQGLGSIEMEYGILEPAAPRCRVTYMDHRIGKVSVAKDELKTMSEVPASICRALPCRFHSYRQAPRNPHSHHRYLSSFAKSSTIDSTFTDYLARHVGRDYDFYLKVKTVAPAPNRISSRRSYLQVALRVLLGMLSAS